MPDKKPTPQYAANTRVDTVKTKAEIEKLLSRYHATAFLPGYLNGMEVLMFEVEGRRIRFSFVTLTPESIDLNAINARRRASHLGPIRDAVAALEQENRTRWRELYLLIKAKLVAVDKGIVSFEDEMLPYTVTANGQTVSEWAKPQLLHIYSSGKMPPLLPGMEEKHGEIQEKQE